MDLKVNDSNFLLKRNGNVLCPTSKSNRIVITDNTAFCRKDNYKACNLTSTDSLTGAFMYYRQSLWSLVPSDSIKMGYRLSLGSSATKKKKHRAKCFRLSTPYIRHKTSVFRVSRHDIVWILLGHEGACVSVSPTIKITTREAKALQRHEPCWFVTKKEIHWFEMNDNPALVLENKLGVFKVNRYELQQRNETSLDAIRCL